MLAMSILDCKSTEERVSTCERSLRVAWEIISLGTEEEASDSEILDDLEGILPKERLKNR